MKPRLEDGYTRFANGLLEALIVFRVPGEAMQVLLFIARKTYGYGKKNDAISISQFAEATGMKGPSICRAIKKLEEMNMITVVRSKKYAATIYQINKYCDTWVPATKRLVNKVRSLPSRAIDAESEAELAELDDTPLAEKLSELDETQLAEKLTGVDESVLAKVLTNISKSANKVVAEELINVSKRARYKRKKEIKEKKKGEVVVEQVAKTIEITMADLPAGLQTQKFFDTWQEWCSYRKEIRKALTPTTVKMQLNKLLGMGVNKAIISLKQSMLQGWQGVFEPRGNAMVEAQSELTHDEMLESFYKQT